MPLGSETILLVEDEPLVRAMVATMLKAQGYAVLEAANGDEALRVAGQEPGHRIDLLLTDVVMPQMGGLELTEKFSDLYPEAQVILMSGYTEEITSRANVPRGGAFLQKRVYPAFDQVVRRPGLHGQDINLAVPLPGQQN